MRKIYYMLIFNMSKQLLLKLHSSNFYLDISIIINININMYKNLLTLSFM